MNGRNPHIYIGKNRASQTFVITGDEAHHMLRVLRVKSGYLFVAFDGLGNGWQCEVIECGVKKVTARIIEEIEGDPQFLSNLTVAVGCIKGSRMDWAVEKAAETGAHSFIPLLTKRSVVEPGKGKIERWNGIALAAAKQSRRLRLMEIREPVGINDVINRNEWAQTWLMHKSSGAFSIDKLCTELKLGDSLLLIIGPEGGFDENELECAILKGVKQGKLGEKALRTETAVAVSLGIIENALSGSDLTG